MHLTNKNFMSQYDLQSNVSFLILNFNLGQFDIRIALNILVCLKQIKALWNILNRNRPRWSIWPHNPLNLKLIPCREPFLYSYTIHSNNTSDDIFRRYNFPKANFILRNSTIHSWLIIYVLSYASHFTKETILHVKINPSKALY